MGNICAMYCGCHNYTVDDYNLLLVSKGGRPAYLWYPSKDRLSPPNIDKYEDLIMKEFLDGFVFIKKTNDIDFSEKCTKKFMGRLLGYLYPGKCEKGYQYWISFKLNGVILWCEAAPSDCDLNLYATRLKEIQSIKEFEETYLIIKYKYLDWNNPY
jgi:hypothetical protein